QKTWRPVPARAMRCAPCRHVVACYIGRVGPMVEGGHGGRRADGRRAGELRPVKLMPGFLPPAEGSALIEMGSTRVVCTATVQESVPPFLRGQGRGWVTAEYAMLPRSAGERGLLDLAYAEDSRAEVDLNLVMTGAGRYVEVQGTAEGKPFTERQLERLLAVARAGLGELTALQRATLRAAGVDLTRRG